MSWPVVQFPGGLNVTIGVKESANSTFDRGQVRDQVKFYHLDLWINETGLHGLCFIDGFQGVQLRIIRANLVSSVQNGRAHDINATMFHCALQRK